MPVSRAAWLRGLYDPVVLQSILADMMTSRTEPGFPIIHLSVAAGLGPWPSGYVSASAIRDVLQSSQGMGVVYYYFDFNDDAKKNLRTWFDLSSVSLCRRSIVLPEGIRNLFAKCDEGKLVPSSIQLLASGCYRADHKRASQLLYHHRFYAYWMNAMRER
jgi:hypothetical protein